MPTYARCDLAFERGEGAWLFTPDGDRYLDFAAGIAVNALGHCHPRMVEALTKQGNALWHCSNLYQMPGQESVAARLVESTFADSVFFNNSGAEAIECGLKMVRRYHDLNGAPERYRVITLEGAFHGRTLATIAAGGQAKHLDGFDPIIQGFDQVPFGNLNELRAAVTGETGAILIEPVQGEGGIVPASAEYLRGLRQVADEFGLLLFFDEIQCGMGRTGKLFAHEWAGVTPDIMAIAKGIGGGFPIGAVLAVEKAAAALTAGTHGSTFGGNPLAMAVAGAVLDTMLADGFLEGVEAIAANLRARLEGLAADHPAIIAEVRGRGLMIGLKCAVENRLLLDRLRANRLLCVPGGGNVVRLLPPLIIDQGHVDEAMSILEKSCAELEAGGN
jgi:acetylornithine/N-succinyldiaminopimelate aminotransferase